MTALIDLPNLTGKKRKDFGLQNVVGLDESKSLSKFNPPNVLNAHRMQRVREKLSVFCERAIFPQQLTVPRQYATTREGTFIFRVLDSRMIDGVRENGIRVIVQENLMQARFVISPLFASKFDALSWAKSEMGAEIGNL